MTAESRHWTELLAQIGTICLAYKAVAEYGMLLWEFEGGEFIPMIVDSQSAVVGVMPLDQFKEIYRP